MKKSKMALIFILTFVLMAIALLAVRANSLAISLKHIGLDLNNIHIIEQHGFDSNNQEYKVIQSTSKTGMIALANVTKNRFGFWTVIKYKLSNAEVQPNFVGIAWLEGAGAKRFLHMENAIFEQEWHYAYCGNNAMKLIEFLPGQIPSNVTVNIQQAGEIFWIHIISFDEPEVINSFNVREILEENQCIPSNKIVE